MIKFIFSTICICLAFVSFNASAAPVYVFNNTGQITGLNGLEFDGATWDMTLHDGSFDGVLDTYGTSAIYSGGYPNPQHAMDALSNFYISDTYRPNSEDWLGCTSTNTCTIWTVFSYIFNYDHYEIVGIGYEYLDDPGRGDSYDETFTHYDLSDLTYATWEHATVPIPSAVWLFGSGLIGLIGLARRKTS